jgi:hypothetical protein
LNEEKELEREGMFTALQPEDSSSHNFILRENKNEKGDHIETSREEENKND